MKRLVFLRRCVAVGALLLGVMPLQAQKGKALPTAIAPYFEEVSNEPKSPTSDGFIQRWLLLEPISAPIRTNIIFTDSYLRSKFTGEYQPSPMQSLPKAGSVVKRDGSKLRWHALDSKLYNVKLFRFATSFEKPKYGVVFWAVTAIDAPCDMEGVRLAVGSNGASMWWLNGSEAVLLSGDRRMVKDDVLSPRLTLRKGRNYLVGAIINGPGMSDFCVRFLDETMQPVQNININVK